MTSVQVAKFSKPLQCDAITHHYYLLRNYSLGHAECHAIMRIID
ncbi:antirestriction protein [Klebsiella pneumoniae]